MPVIKSVLNSNKCIVQNENLLANCIVFKNNEISASNPFIKRLDGKCAKYKNGKVIIVAAKTKNVNGMKIIFIKIANELNTPK